MRIVPRLLLAAVALTLSACSMREHASSGAIGCPADEIEIVDSEGLGNRHNWTAVCRGRTYHCSGLLESASYRDVQCSPEADGAPLGGGAPAPAAGGVEATPQPANGEASVVREQAQDGTGRLVATFEAQPFLIRVVSEPVRHPATMLLVVEASGRSQQRAECDVRVLVDGALADLAGTTYQFAAGREQLRVTVSREQLAAWVAADRVASRVCDEEWRLEGTGRATLQELLARVQEELAFSGQATSGGEQPDPEGETRAEAQTHVEE